MCPQQCDSTLSSGDCQPSVCVRACVCVCVHACVCVCVCTYVHACEIRAPITVLPLHSVSPFPLFQESLVLKMLLCTIFHSQGSAVQCTCTGFHVPSLVKLWQSFRTYGMSGAISTLPKITCSTCQHTLQSHQPMETSSTPTDGRNSLEGGTRMPWGEASTIIQHPQLTLKASTKLAFTPFNGCIQILPPENKTGNVVLVSLHSVAEGDLHIVVCSVQLALEQIHTLLEETAGDQTSASKDSKELESCLEKQSDMTEENSEGNVEEPLPAKKKSRRRKRITRVNVVPRKSARLQKQSEKRKALENKQAVARLLEEERKRQEREIEQARVEQQMLCRCIVEYVSLMEKKDSFTHYPLPEVM